MREAAPGLRLEVGELRYGGEPLFSDLALEVEGGRWSCLLGPSGAGKTTLLRLLAGLEPGARVRASDGGPVVGRVAYMAQTDLLLPWLPVLENVLLGWRLRGRSRAELAAARERARALLADVGLGGYAQALPQTLSGGMRQRAALARTLMEARPIVLMDEPFSALDAITRHRLQAQAAELLTGRTVLLVTHDPREALRLGHVVFVLAGRPASLQGPLHLPGVPARDPTAPEVVAEEARLLRTLMAAAAS